MDAEIKQEFIGAGIDVDDAMHRFMERDDLFVRFMKDYLEDDNLEKMKSSLADGNVGDGQHAGFSPLGPSNATAFRWF